MRHLKLPTDNRRAKMNGIQWGIFQKIQTSNQ